MRRLTYLIACLATLGAGATTAAAQPGQGPAGAARLAAVVQRRLKLTNEQSAKLQTVTRRFAAEREQLVMRERVARRSLRDLVAVGDSADQQAIGRQLDDLLRLQQRRTAILADEQRELATFLTPLQRAEFLGMQERAFRAAQQIRQQRQGAGVPRPPLRP